MAEKNFNVPLPDYEVGERFMRFIRPKGQKKGYAVAGALELFMVLPADIREMLMEGRVDEAKAWLDGLREDAMAWAVSQPVAPSSRRAARKGRADGRKK